MTFVANSWKWVEVLSLPHLSPGIWTVVLVMVNWNSHLHSLVNHHFLLSSLMTVLLAQDMEVFLLAAAANQVRLTSLHQSLQCQAFLSSAQFLQLSKEMLH